MAPKYLENLLCINNREGIASNLHSSNSVVLIVPYVKNKTCAICSFSVQEPIWWNTLLMGPANILTRNSITHSRCDGQEN